MGRNGCASRPRARWLASTSYVVTLTSELKDVSGNALTNPGTISFTTGPDSDTTAPTVTASTPYYNETEVGRRPVIRVAFSEMINPISVTSTSFYLYNYYTNALVRSTITIAPDRLSATLVPDTVLEPHSYYYYYVSPFADIAGNTGGLGATYFRTGGVEDTQPPTLVSIAPANGATECPGQRPHSGRCVRAHRRDVDRRVQLTPAVAGSIAVDADRLGFLFTPAANLAVSTAYTLQIGPLRDSSGNTMAAVVSVVHDQRVADARTTPRSPDSRSASSPPPTAPPNVSGHLADRVDRERAHAHERSRRRHARLCQHPALRQRAAGRHLHRQRHPERCITFTPLVPYPGGTAITVYSNYDSTTTDLAGNALQHLSATFTTATGRGHDAADGRHGDAAGWGDGHRTGRDRDADVLGAAPSVDGQQRHVHAVRGRRGDHPHRSRDPPTTRPCS